MHWVNRILLAGLIAAGVAFGPAQFETAATNHDLSRIRGERVELRDTNEAIREETRLLAAEVQALKADPAEVARIARDDLNLVMPGEVVFEVERITAKAER